MISTFGHAGNREQMRQNIVYIHEMLGQLRHAARVEGADMLCYLIEMAFLEAGDLQAGRRPLSMGRPKALDAQP